MKKVQLILTTLFFFAFTTISSGQLYIDAENNVAVGNDSTSADAKMKILTTIEDYGLKIVNNKNTNSFKYGLGVEVNEQGTGHKRGVFSTVRQSPSSADFAYGFYADVVHFGAGPSVGFYAGANTGTGSKVGVNTSLAQPSSSGATMYGFTNSIFQNGTGETRGISTELTVNSTAQGYGEFILVTGNGSNTTQGLYVDMIGTGSGDKVGVFSRVPSGSNHKAGNFVGDVYMNGQIVLTSDERFKRDIGNLTGALAIVNQIQPKTYKFLDLPHHGNDPDLKQYGFLAQELEAVLPDLVKEVTHYGRKRPDTKDLPNPLETDLPIEPGTLIQLEPDETVKAVNYIGLIPILTKAIQEQQTIIEDLRTRLERVERN